MQLEQNMYSTKDTEVQRFLKIEQLEILLKNSETTLNDQRELPKYYMGDCPCPCPPIVTAVVYVTFSPIF